MREFGEQPVGMRIRHRKQVGRGKDKLPTACEAGNSVITSQSHVYTPSSRELRVVYIVLFFLFYSHNNPVK